MQISQDKVVHIHYTLTTNDGELVDRSPQDEPLGYLHGKGQIIPGLEKALEGRSSGEAFSVDLPPEEGYGERDERLVQPVPRSAFEGIGEVQPGMQLQAQTSDGPRVVTVAKVQDDTVHLDANHPLAGQTLKFEIEVARVREATAAELIQGQIEEDGA